MLKAMTRAFLADLPLPPLSPILSYHWNKYGSKKSGQTQVAMQLFASVYHKLKSSTVPKADRLHNQLKVTRTNQYLSPTYALSKYFDMTWSSAPSILSTTSQRKFAPM
ncbi:hypothetical protein CPB86DRAFT_812279 [Serendipita vermifera]|nr:hypothetical protein CPB86DRAFT_812279 [Serendipita vermifera]